MKHIIMSTLPLVLTPLLIPLPVSAQTYSACDSASYVVLPGGQCVDLGYLGILGDSRATRSQIESAYQQQFDANVELEMLYYQYPQYVSETEEERDERYRALYETSVIRDEAVSSNEVVESTLYPLQCRNMAIMRDAFVHHRYDYRSLLQQ